MRITLDYPIVPNGVSVVIDADVTVIKQNLGLLFSIIREIWTNWR